MTEAALPDLKRLRGFDAVARADSLVAAAEGLGVTQPALSYLLTQLEAELGARLFVRGARGSAPTPAGAALARRTERFFAQMAAAFDDLAGEARGARQKQAALRRVTGAHLACALALHAHGAPAAAQRLGVRPAALARRLRDLERVVGAGLVHTVGGLRFTAAGAELARRLAVAAEEIWSGLDEMESPLAPRRGLRVGALVLSPRLLLAQALEAPLARYPMQTVEIVEGTFEELVGPLRAGALDLIFGAVRAPAPFDDLAEEALLEDPYVVACRRRHPLARRARVGSADLARYDFVVPTAGLRNAVLARFLARHGLAPPRQIHTSWLASITALVRASDRLALLSRWHIDSD
ncbi:MAG TPA: LysR family transcriptional regulator, partial [Beijerinckiaceae bacterium]